MAEEYKVDNLREELGLYLHSQSRRGAFPQKSLVLKAEFKNIPHVSDTSNKMFAIDMTHLISFRDYFNDKSYKFIRLYDWEFYLTFKKKKCIGIELNSQHVALIASKNVKKQIKDCTFSIEIATETEIDDFSKKEKEYLNRLGKRNLVAQSEYVAQEHYSLISFIKKPVNFSAIEKVCMPAKKEVSVDPLNFLNQRGKDLLEKLRSFISRQDLLNFMVEQELSEEGQRQMRRLILSEAMGSGSKKKPAYARNIIESLQKNLHE